MAEAIILVGLPGAGKTTYLNEHFALTHEIVSRDELKIAEREAALLAKCIRSGRSFVVDNTNTTRAIRRTYINVAKIAGFHLRAYYFELPVRTAIGRNNHRKDKKPVPVPGILRLAKHLEPPSLDEGFDEVRTIMHHSPEAPASGG